MPGRTRPAALERARRLEAMRFRGTRGRLIPPHRAMVGLPWTLWRTTTTLGLALGGLALVGLGLPALGRAWTVMFRAARGALFPGVPLGDRLVSLPGGIDFALPVLAAGTPLPGPTALLVAGAVILLLVLLSFLLPDRWLPLRYFLGVLALLQASAILFFALAPAAFPYHLQDHVFLLMAAGLVVMALVPVLLGFTLHVFDLALWKKAFLTLALLVHLAVFLPLQGLVHAWLVLQGTALVMPVLFLAFGLLMDVLIFVAFYGWALSWRGELETGQLVPPVHLGGRKGARR